MRYIIYGAGAIGGTIGARLFQAGNDVILIARGAHLEALQGDGLTLRDPHGDVTLKIPAVGHPNEIAFTDQDAILLAMKSQHTEAALDDLKQCHDDLPIVCAQNGVANERLASQRFSRVYGMVVLLPATHLDPGIVLHHSLNVGGVLDAGVYPAGTDDFIRQVMQDLESANFSAVADETIMRWKYAKLLMNLGNGLQAVCDAGADARDLSRLMVHEALACFEAAGIDCATGDEARERRGDFLQSGPISGSTRGGGSSWQSVHRGTGSIETDFLNGEIVSLGETHGIPTPVNQLIQALANKVAIDRLPPGSISLAEVHRMLDEDEYA